MPAEFARRSPWLYAATVLLACAASTHATPPVRMVPVPATPEFPDAVEPGALSRACAANLPDVERFLHSRGVPFDRSLAARGAAGDWCHIYFEPTVPGFRAATDNGRVLELVASVDPFSFVAGRKPIGDPLDIAKAILANLSKPVRLSLIVPMLFDRANWPQARQAHFPRRHEIALREGKGVNAQPWAHDYIKPGDVQGRRRILFPRRLYEGRNPNGSESREFLSALEDAISIRSKLSWEGGDIQFVSDPERSGSLVLLYGGMARHYWGRNLTAREYEYVLRQEFGAGRAIDLSQFGPHVDYLVAVLANSRTALVARPVVRDRGLAEAAAVELLRIYGERAPAKLADLAALLRNEPAAEQVLEACGQLRRILPQVAAPEDGGLAPDLASYVARNCPNPHEPCATGKGASKMLRTAPELLRRALNLAADLEAERAAAPRLLGLIEAQFRSDNAPDFRLFDRTEEAMRGLGLRVVRVPYLIAPHIFSLWSGVSYTNSVEIAGKLFVPAFGLGAAEERIFAELRLKLGPSMEVIPVPARYSLLHNAGVHCALGVVRGTSGR